MKKLVLITLVGIGVVSFLSFKDRDPGPGMTRIINPPQPFAVTNAKLNANTINTWFRTNGSFNYDPFNQNNPGFEWPKGQGKFCRFASGLWLGAVVGNDTLVTQAEYGFEFLQGYTDNSGNPQGKDDPVYRIYRLCTGGADCIGQDVTDRAQWPNALLGNSDQGAPVFFDSATGQWKPLDVGTQTIWAAFTDSYPESHTQYQTAPLKADIKMTSFSFDLNGPVGQLAFTQWVIINRGSNVWNNAYLTAWSDDDDGYANDDRVGCDSVNGLGYTYNGAPSDPVYGAQPPAVGFDFFRGAIIYTGNPTDTAFICRGEGINVPGRTRDTLIGYKQLGLSVFCWYANNNDPVNGNPLTAKEAYRYMSGDRRDGSPTINPIGNYRTRLMYTGDPVQGSGWNQSENNDQRFLQSTGPFTMNPGDTQIVVIGQVVAASTNNLTAINAAKQIDVLAQKLYDNCFNVPTCAPPPKISSYAPGDGNIYLSWDDADERMVLPNKIRGSEYRFQGYNVYQVRAGTNGSKASDRILLATFDVIDGITDIRDTVVDEFGISVWAIVQRGTNSGISRFIRLTRDKFLDQNFINGTPYYFSVTAYHYDSLAGPTFASSTFCESSIPGGLITVIPQRLTQGTQTFYQIGDTIPTNRRDLAVMPVVIQPLSLISATYQSVFRNVNDTLKWFLFREGVPLDTSTDFTGTQDTIPLIDGFFPIHVKLSADSGVVKDPNDPLRLQRSISTKLGGWTYTPPENRWFQGPDTSAIKTIPSNALFRGRQFESRTVGVSFPTSNTYRGIKSRIFANGPYFYVGSGANPSLTGGPLRKVRIVFGQQQLAYRYVPTSPLPDTNFTTTPYVDYVNVPFQVFAVDPLDSSGGSPRQLNCAFIDADNNGQWDPDASPMGKFQIVYIFASSYDPNPSIVYTSRNPGSPSTSLGFGGLDIMYAWVPRVRPGGPQTYQNGDVFEIYPYIPTRGDFVPGFPVNYSWTVQGSIISSSSLAAQNNQMDKVKVFPNPYYGTSRLETDPVNRFVYFSNLPAQCTIYIYTLDGILIRKINRSVTNPQNSLEPWDLRNDSDIPVASGMYIALVDAPGIGTKVLKLAIFTPEERIDTF